MAHPSLYSLSALLAMYSLLLLAPTSAAILQPNFYEKTCPNLFSTVKRVVENAVANEARMGASLLRLHFHDCFVNGCDASVLLDDKPGFVGEKTANPNRNSARGFEVVDQIKAAVEKVCPGVVSCADILTIAARDSVVALRGPYWDVFLGRRDATTASKAAANTDIPAPTFSISQLIQSFAKFNLSANDMVALSGAHTIGMARCTNFRSRVYNETNIDKNFAKQKRDVCPPRGKDNDLQGLDDLTDTCFDKNYFVNLVNLKGLLHSDQQLFNKGSTDSLVEKYSSGKAEAFFDDFVSAIIKMGNIKPLTGEGGEIRKDCRVINKS